MARILLVDDDHSLLVMFKNALETENHTAVTAYNGEQALSALNTSIDLMICDVQMPHMDGRELIQRVRTQSDYARLLIIAMTAYPKAVKPFGNIEGADGVILKPVSIVALFDMVNDLLEQRRNSA